MQIKILEKDNLDEKLKTRKLYEKCFDFDKINFIDYYYDVIIKRNEIAVMLDDDHNVVSMIHLNPYTYSVLGKTFNVHYLVAVATAIEHRGKGYMRKVMDEALNYLKELGEPFCYIVPADEKLLETYSKFGFIKAAKFNIDKFSDDIYDIYPIKNEEYLELMKKEKYFLDLEAEEYKKDLSSKSVLIKVLNPSLLPRDIDLCAKKIYVCQEV